MDEMKTCLLCLVVLSSLLSGTDATNETIIVQPSVTVNLINDSAFFNCSTTSQKVEWLFGSDQYPQPFIYSYGKVNQIYKDRFQVEIYTHNYRKWFNLILQSVAKGDAGRYICRDPDNLNEEGRAVHLTVLETEPACNSNLSSDGLVIGPNSCAIKQESVQLSCSVRYTGNQVPELQWTKTGENIAINSSICSHSGNVYTCNLTMESELEMEGYSYVCQTTQSMTKQYNCTSGVFRILYALAEQTELIGSVNDKVNCSVSSNSQSCTLSWIFNDGITNRTESHDPVIELKRPGRFICEVNCPIRNINCIFTAMTVNVTDNKLLQGDDIPIAAPFGVLVVVVVIVVAAATLVGIICAVKHRKKRQNGQNVLNRGKSLESVFLNDENVEDALVGQYSTQEEQMSPKVEHAEEVSNGQDSSEAEPLSEDDRETVDGDNVQRITPKAAQQHHKRIKGLTILKGELFVACEKSNIIEVFTIDSLVPKRESKIAGLKNPGTIAACAKNKCLYIMDQRSKYSRRRIFRVKQDGTVITTWYTNEDDRGRIAVNQDGNVIMAVYHKHRVKKYSPTGILEMTLDFSGTSIDYVFHAIELAVDNFIISHGIHTSSTHRVCKIHIERNVLESSGSEKGSDKAQPSSTACIQSTPSDRGCMTDTASYVSESSDSDLKSSASKQSSPSSSSASKHSSPSSSSAPMRSSPSHHKIDAKDVLESFGNKRGKGDSQLSSPAYLAVRSDGSILVADQNNHRILLLNSELKCPKKLFTERNDVKYPETMYVHETGKPTLFLGCNKTRKTDGYIRVFPLDRPINNTVEDHC